MPILGRRHPELVEIAGPLPPAWLRARTWNWGMGLNPGNFWVNSWNPIDSEMVPPGRLEKNPKGARNVSGNDVQRIQPRDFWVPYFQTPDKPQWALVQLGDLSSTNLWFSNELACSPHFWPFYWKTHTQLPKACKIKVQLLPSLAGCGNPRRTCGPIASKPTQQPKDHTRVDGPFKPYHF